MIRIWADFNAQVGDGRISLHTVGSKRDLEPYQDELREGLQVLLHQDDEFEVEATLTCGRKGWLAIPDMSTIRYLDEGERKARDE